jgi:hypothetical protein
MREKISYTKCEVEKPIEDEDYRYKESFLFKDSCCAILLREIPWRISQSDDISF